MPDKERLIKLLSDYGISDRYIDDLCDEIDECYFDELADAEKWRKVMEVYHKDDERFVQFANTISKIRELDALTEKEAT